MGSLEDATSWLELVGFRLRHKDHGLVIGLSQEECEGHQVCIEQRMEQARRLIATCSKLLPNEGSTFMDWLPQVKLAADKCSRDIRNTSPKDLRKKLWNATDGGAQSGGNRIVRRDHY